MLVRTASEDMVRPSAHTGAPAWAITAAAPIERSNVLFPDMFEPVTNSAVPGPRNATSFSTRLSLETKG